MQVYLIHAALQLENPQPSMAPKAQLIQERTASESRNIEHIMDTVVQELARVGSSTCVREGHADMASFQLQHPAKCAS